VAAPPSRLPILACFFSFRSIVALSIGAVFLYDMLVHGPADIDLINRFKNGDTSAFEEIVLKYQDKVYNLCRHMLGNRQDAEDAAQDVFLKAFQALPKFQPDASLYTWLYRIAANTCIDHRKKPIFESLFGDSGEGEKLIHDRASDAPSPEKLYRSKQIDQALQESLGMLSPKLRAIIILKEIEELSYEEIADALEISMGTVKSRIARARAELQKFMHKFREQNPR
jgi:RNA polymerase sigma-70 factor (ECF subfamily)